MLEKLQNLDRRWIFTFILFAVIGPLMFPLNLGIKTSEPVENIYNYVENLPEGSIILMSFDYSPSTEIELGPASLSVARHAFRKNHKVIAIALWPDGAVMGREVLEKAAGEYKKEKGKDYVNLGYKAGGSVILMNLKDDFSKTFPKDVENNPINEFPLMNRVKNINDVSLVLSFSAGVPGIREHINIVSTQFGKKTAGAVTGVTAPEMYAFLDSGQLLGLMGGLKGAAEYEHMLALPEGGRAMKAMDAQSVVHLLIVLFIIFANVIYFVGEYRKKKME